MQKTLFQLIVLVFALNNVACACMPAVDEDAVSAHQNHQLHGDTQAKDHHPANDGDCCEGCDRLSILKRSAENSPVLPLNSDAEDFDFDILASKRLLIAWQQISFSLSPHPGQSKHPCSTTTVKFFDRMLD